MTTRPPTFDEALAHAYETERRLTAERVALAERRARYELKAQQVPTPINWRRVARVITWACLFVAGCAGLGIGAFNWRAPFGLALAVGGLGVLGLLTAAARRVGAGK